MGSKWYSYIIEYITWEQRILINKWENTEVENCQCAHTKVIIFIGKFHWRMGKLVGRDLRISMVFAKA